MSLRSLVLATLALLCALPTPASAGSRFRDGFAPAPWIHLSVEDLDERRVLMPVLSGTRLSLVGPPGHRYALLVHNPTPERLLVVLSVDGVNVLTGQDASPNQAGYVVPPYGRVRVDGWGKNMDDTTAAFVFTPLPTRNADRLVGPTNVGAIGAAVFRERDRVVGLGQRPEPREGAAPVASMGNVERRESLETSLGERSGAPVTPAQFDRASGAPVAVVRLWYDSRRREHGVPTFGAGQRPH